MKVKSKLHILYEYQLNIYLTVDSVVKNTFHLYCFIETNLHEGVPHNFVINDYRAEQLYAIDGKRKGSGISIYYHNKVSFSRLRSLDFRNNYFECMGGSVNTEFGKCFIIVFYRFNTSIDDSFYDSLTNIITK